MKLHISKNLTKTCFPVLKPVLIKNVPRGKFSFYNHSISDKHQQKIGYVNQIVYRGTIRITTCTT